MSERICVAKVEDVQIGPNTEMTVECGLTNREHLHTHIARQTVAGAGVKPSLTVTISWQGDFVPPAKEEGGDE
jgi:hypothetical protein